MKYLKLNIPLSQEDFEKLTNKLKDLDLEYHFKLKTINGGIESFLPKYKHINNGIHKSSPEPYIYRSKFLKNKVYANTKPPKKYNVDTGEWEIDGKELNYNLKY